MLNSDPQPNMKSTQIKPYGENEKGNSEAAKSELLQNKNRLITMITQDSKKSDG